MRLALEIAARVRAASHAHKPLFFHLLAVNGSVDCWSLDDSIVLARELAQRGVDVISCSSGGFTEEMPSLPVPRGLGFQVPFPSYLRGLTQGLWPLRHPPRTSPFVTG